jgi:1-acyl-sn-glycerol-3-phosphate acyltransferase
MIRHDGIACGRDPLVDAIATFLARDHAFGMTGIRASLEEAIDAAGPDAIEDLARRLADAGSDWSYYPRDPLARDIHRALAGRVLRHDPIVRGVEHLDLVRGKRLVIFANHLSYSDANAVDVLLQGAGATELADRLTVIAGPKVYSNVRRRFSSLCFGTIKVPQTSARSTGEAVMNPRDVARAARRSIEVAHERLRLGEALLVFPEGARSRSGDMQRLLSGAARYIELPDTWVLPIGLTGTERLFPMSEDSLNPVRITLAIGRPVPVSRLDERANGDRQLVMDAIGIAIADLLPVEYRGVYGNEVVGDLRARAVSQELFA